MAKKKKTAGKRLISALSALITMGCMFVTVAVVVLLLMYFKYHESKCDQYEPSSQFLIGDVFIIRACPFPTELWEKALVESYSDGGEPDA